MKLIVGLGNPGKQFENTPHNAGFMAVDGLARELVGRACSVTAWTQSRHEKSEMAEVYQNNKKIAVLTKPQTYMNLSGGAVQQVMASYGIKDPQDVLVIYDELDIKLGEFKYSPIKNSRTHKGINSVLATVGKQVHSLRIGVDTRKNHLIPGEDFVLQRYSTVELELLQNAIKRAIPLHVLPFLALA